MPDSTRKRSSPAEVAARMTALGAKTDTAPPMSEETPPVTTTEDTAPVSSRAPARSRRPMPVEQAKPATYSQRINLTVTPDQNRALGQAGLDDGIDKTFRIRAMIALWQEDERLRKRIDKRAQQEQFRR